MALPGPLDIAPRLLLGPGPSDVHPRVLSAMTTPLLGHLDPQFLQLMGETQDMLRLAFQTKNPFTFPVSATGMAGMETCIVNLLEPGDKVVVCVAGFFSMRMTEIVPRTGAVMTRLDCPWGKVFDLDQIRDTLAKVRPKVLAIVHAETTTGALQPMEQLGKLCHEFDCLLLVDAVTSLGTCPLDVDGWEIDAIYSCSQKGLCCPPGLSPVSFSPRALEAINRRKTKVQSWYFDVTTVQRYWGQDRAYHHTAPITMIYAIREGLRILLEEGLQARWERHRYHHRAMRAGLAGLGLKYAADEKHLLPPLNAVFVPPGIDDAAVRRQLLDQFGIEVGGGLGDFKGKVLRIGIMGNNARANTVLLLLAALDECLQHQGAKHTPGAGVAAANQIYNA